MSASGSAAADVDASGSGDAAGSEDSAGSRDDASSGDDAGINELKLTKGSSAKKPVMNPEGARPSDTTWPAGDIEEGNPRDEQAIGPVPMSAEPSQAATTSRSNRSDAEPDPDADPESRYGFAHPAISRPQRTVWIPEDELGMWKVEVEGCEEEGVGAARGPDGEEVTAWMDRKGKVDVRGGPPDLVGV